MDISFSSRLRQQHQKLIIQLEQRQQQEMYEHKKALEREFENHMHTFDKEMEKLKTKHKQELEQKVCVDFSPLNRNILRIFVHADDAYVTHILAHLRSNWLFHWRFLCQC